MNEAAETGTRVAPAQYAAWLGWQRVALFLGVVLGLALLTTKWRTTVVIGAGQAHFGLAYLYAFRAGRIGWKRAVVYVLFASVIVAQFVFDDEDHSIMNALAGFYFAVHFALDQVFLMQRPRLGGGALTPSAVTALRTLGVGTLLPFIGFGAVTLGQPAMLTHIGAGAGLGLAFSGFLTLRAATPGGVRAMPPELLIFLSLIASLVWAAYSKAYSFAAYALDVIIVYHYIDWYLSSGLERVSRPAEYRRFKIECVVANIVSMGFASAHVVSRGEIPFASLVWGYNEFGAWTLLHYVSVARPEDFRPLWHSMLRLWRGPPDPGLNDAGGVLAP
jgi:hypothetical protein